MYCQIIRSYGIRSLITRFDYSASLSPYDFIFSSVALVLVSSSRANLALSLAKFFSLSLKIFLSRKIHSLDLNTFGERARAYQAPTHSTVHTEYLHCHTVCLLFSCMHYMCVKRYYFDVSQIICLFVLRNSGMKTRCHFLCIYISIDLLF